MARPHEIATDELVGILEKAMKTKPTDKKARADFHKKASSKAKALQTDIADIQEWFIKSIDKGTRTLEETFGVAASEAKLFERAIVRHLRKAIKLSKSTPRPKGWTENFDKAAKSITGWDPKSDKADGLADGVKYLEAGKKAIQTQWEAYRKAELECNKAVDEALKDLVELKDDKLKALLKPYFDTYMSFFSAPS
jgi:hypothetical protein